MAPKRPTPTQDPPSSSSSEEEEEEAEEEEDEEEEEEEAGGEGDSTDEEEANEKGKGVPTTTQKKNTQKTSSPPPPPPPLAQPAKPASKNEDLNAAQSGEEDDESESSESETDSDAERPASPIVKKPISSKPMVEAATPTKTTKLRSKSSTAAASPKPVASAKRGPETDRYEKDAKRAKKDLEEDGVASTGGEKSDGKKQLFQRLWSEEDEIVVLRGVIDFKGKKGIEPAKDMPAFYDFIKNSLHIDVTQAQLKDKVWRLKKKFENLVKKGKNGEEKTFTKDHDQKAFDLSKKIWGSETIDSKVSVAGGESGVIFNEKLKMGGNEKANVKTSAELKEQVELAPSKDKKTENFGFEGEIMLGVGKLEMNGGMEEYVLRKAMEMMDGAKREEMEERMRKLLVEDIKLFLKRNELVRENALLLLAAYTENDQD